MVSGLVIDERIAEEIRFEGKKQAKTNKESVGLLFGPYNEKRDSIIASNKYHITTKIGAWKEYDSLRDRIYDKIKVIQSIPRLVHFNVIEFPAYLWEQKDKGKSAGLVLYHTHAIGLGWSIGDLNAMDVFEKIENRELAYLLYAADEDGFIAANEEGKEIPIYIENIEALSR